MFKKFLLISLLASFSAAFALDMDLEKKIEKFNNDHKKHDREHNRNLKFQNIVKKVYGSITLVGVLASLKAKSCDLPVRLGLGIATCVCALVSYTASYAEQELFFWKVPFCEKNQLMPGLKCNCYDGADKANCKRKIRSK